MCIQFGSYAQIFDDPDPTNTPHARTLGAVALDPTGDAQGTYHFMSLATGALLSRHRWTELPIPNTAIARVHALALCDGQPLLQDRGLVVEWRPAPDHPIDNSEYDLSFIASARPSPTDNNLSHDYNSVTSDELADLAKPFYDPLDILPATQGAIPDTANAVEFENEGAPNTDEHFENEGAPNEDEHINPDEDTAKFENEGAPNEDEYANANEFNEDDDPDATDEGTLHEDEGAPTTDNTDDEIGVEHIPASS